MTEFASYRGFQIFAKHIKQERRYFHDATTEEFLIAVHGSSQSRQVSISEGRIWWRAQLGHDMKQASWVNPKFDFKVAVPFSKARMKPQSKAATEGRINPKGIPCLYLSEYKETAMSEVRPWIGQYVSVGKFEAVRDLKLVDCSKGHGKVRPFYEKEPPPKERERAVWINIDRAFSTPVTPNESTADYAPTQVLSEFFRVNGLDGILYKSLLGEGRNIALFDLAAAKLIDCQLFEVKKASFAFKERKDD